MTIDIQGLNEKALQVLHNSDEFVRKWNEFLAAPAGNVSLEYYDENGNLQTATFSNRNKLVQDFIANVNSAMTKTFYVDSINGDDNNDGSSAEPFATLHKAVDSVPVGGLGTVHLKGGQTHVIDRDIEINNKIIYFKTDNPTGNQEDNAWIKNIGYLDANGNATYGIKQRAGLVIFERVNIETASFVDPSQPMSLWEGLFKRWDTGEVRAAFHECIINLGDTDLIRTPTGGHLQVNIHFYNCDIRQVGTNRAGIVAYLENGKSTLSISESGSLVTLQDGSAGTWADLISGIVKDANGVPRNVISNLIL